MTDTPELPPLPEPDMGHQKAPDDCEWETSYSAEAMRAYAAEAVRVAQGWRPIETAPKDGTQILAWAPDFYPGFYGVAEWAEKQDWRPETVAGWFWNYATRPTHWMPLPTPPQADQA